MLTYQEPAYAADRLVGTIVRHKNLAVRVDAIDMDGQTRVSYITTGRRDDAKLKDLDITPVPLGFCNFNRTVTYLSRSPVRQDWKQGLRNKTLRSSSALVHIDDIPFKAIGATIEGKYPKLDVVFGHLKEGGAIQMAWCRDFAVDADLNIYYKALGIVGKFLDPKERRFTLAKEYHWVQESLEEAMNG